MLERGLPEQALRTRQVWEQLIGLMEQMDELLGQDDFESLHRFLLDRRRAGADPENPVVIGAETTVRWKFVVKAMDAAVRAGFTNVQFAVSFRAGSLSDSAAGSP